MLEGGEEGVQLGEVGALGGLLALDGFDDGGEFLLEGKRGEDNWQLPQLLSCEMSNGGSGYKILESTTKRHEP